MDSYPLDMSDGLLTSLTGANTIVVGAQHVQLRMQVLNCQDLQLAECRLEYV